MESDLIEQRLEHGGSGMLNIGKYLPLYSPGSNPEYRDGPVFTTVIPPVTEHVPNKLTPSQHQVGTKFHKAYIRPLLDEGMIVTTIPDKPRSRKQKYLTTEKGKKVLREDDNDV